MAGAFTMDSSLLDDAAKFAGGGFGVGLYGSPFGNRQTITLNGGHRAMDFLGHDGGALAGAFGAGCAAAYGFLQKVLVGPLKKQMEELKDDCEARDRRQEDRIMWLQSLLLTHGTGAMRQEIQKVVSEQNLEIRALKEEK